MYNNEIVFMYCNLLHVSTTHIAIFREIIQRLHMQKHLFVFYVHIVGFDLLIFIVMPANDGFGGLVVSMLPLAPKFAGSNPAEAVGFFGRKNPQHAFLRRRSKIICPMSQLCGM